MHFELNGVCLFILLYFLLFVNGTLKVQYHTIYNQKCIIFSLYLSTSFTYTHYTIKKCNGFENHSPDQVVAVMTLDLARAGT